MVSVLIIVCITGKMENFNSGYDEIIKDKYIMGLQDNMLAFNWEEVYYKSPFADIEKCIHVYGISHIIP